MEKSYNALFVDDEVNVLSAIKRAFLDENCQIYTAASGPDGLAVLEKETVQVVVSDYRMPGMNGIEFLREVNKRWPDTVRIVLSGYADISSIVSAINEGQIYKFIPKPWNDDELKMTLANAAERYFLHEQNVILTSELKLKNEKLEELNVQLAVLLEEQSENLEFRTKVVTSYQNILNAIPAGIIGIDSNRTIVLCNETFLAVAGASWCALGQAVTDQLPREMVDFVAEVYDKQKARKKFILNGVRGILSGVSMKNEDGQEGVVIAFMREDDLQ